MSTCIHPHLKVERDNVGNKPAGSSVVLLAKALSGSNLFLA